MYYPKLRSRTITYSQPKMGTTTYYPKLGDRTITYSQPKMGKIQLQKDTLKKDSSLGLTNDDDDGIMTLR
jgi:hypothetical protein